MTSKSISGLTAAATPLTGAETLPIVQGGTTKQVSVANLTAGRTVASAGGTFTGNLIQGTATIRIDNCLWNNSGGYCWVVYNNLKLIRNSSHE